ncbi:MAG: LysR family transcriptional regulator, partial [Rubrivivax sp.]
MKLQSLQTLAAVLRHGSFAAAAKDVNLSAGAVSLQMQQLEAWFGQPLFDRSARHVRPTPFALEVGRTTQQALDAISRLRRGPAQQVEGVLRLGTVESVQVALLPQAVRRLRSTAPALALQLTRGASSALLDELKAGRLDAAVLVRPQTGGSSRLAWFPLTRENFVLIVPPDAPALPPVELLRRYDWIRFDRSTTGGEIAARYVNRIAPRMSVAFDLPGTEPIAAMVSSGLGVSVVPALRRELSEAFPLRQIGLGRGAPVRHIALVCRRSDGDTRRMRLLHEAFHAAAVQRYAGDGNVRPEP